MDEDLEEFKAWFDSFKEPDGAIDISKHPELLAYFRQRAMPFNKLLNDFLLSNRCFMGTVDYELPIKNV